MRPITHNTVVVLYITLPVILSVDTSLSLSRSFSISRSFLISGGRSGILVPFTLQNVKSPPLVSHDTTAGWFGNTVVFWGATKISVCVYNIALSGHGMHDIDMQYIHFLELLTTEETDALPSYLIVSNLDSVSCYCMYTRQHTLFYVLLYKKPL